MRAAFEHPRITIAIGAILILLALAGGAAGSALGGSGERDAASRTAARFVDARAAAVRHQLQAADAQDVQLRHALLTLQVRTNRPPPLRRCHSGPTPPRHRRREKL